MILHYYVYVLVVNYIVVIYVQKSQISYFALFQFLDQFNVSRLQNSGSKLRTNTVFPVIVIPITTGRYTSEYVTYFQRRCRLKFFLPYGPMLTKRKKNCIK